MFSQAKQLNYSIIENFITYNIFQMELIHLVLSFIAEQYCM